MVRLSSRYGSPHHYQVTAQWCFLLTFHWPEQVTWTHLGGGEAGNCSLALCQKENEPNLVDTKHCPCNNSHSSHHISVGLFLLHKGHFLIGLQSSSLSKAPFPLPSMTSGSFCINLLDHVESECWGSCSPQGLYSFHPWLSAPSTET